MRCFPWLWTPLWPPTALGPVWSPPALAPLLRPLQCPGLPFADPGICRPCRFMDSTLAGKFPQRLPLPRHPYVAFFPPSLSFLFQLSLVPLNVPTKIELLPHRSCYSLIWLYFTSKSLSLPEDTYFQFTCLSSLCPTSVWPREGEMLAPLLLQSQLLDLWLELTDCDMNSKTKQTDECDPRIPGSVLPVLHVLRKWGSARD